MGSLGKIHGLRSGSSSSDDPNSMASDFESDSDAVSHSGESGCSDESEAPNMNIDLNLARLQSLHAGKTKKKNPKHDKYARRALCPDRVRRVLQDPGCDCACRISGQVLVPLLRAFWHLPKDTQDALLWALQD